MRGRNRLILLIFTARRLYTILFRQIISGYTQSNKKYY